MKEQEPDWDCGHARPGNSATLVMCRHCQGIFRELIEVSEEMASSDPDMPSHAETEQRFDIALERAKAILADIADRRPADPAPGE